MLASWPLYTVFAIFPVTVLSIFGPRYTVGASALTVLSLAMLSTWAPAMSQWFC